MAKNVCIVVSDYYKEISNGLEVGAIKFCNENSIEFQISWTLNSNFC